MCIRDRPQRVRHHHVVVREAVHDQHRTVRLHRPGQPVVGDQRVRRIDGRLLVRVAEIPLLVMGVVQPQIGHRRTDHRRMEDIGAAQRRQPREIAAEGPAADRHPLHVQGKGSGQCLEGMDLVVQGDVREVAEHRLLPCGGAARGAPPVRDDHREPLVGEPLGGQMGVVRGDHPLAVRAAVRIHQHRQRTVALLISPGQQHRARNLAFPGAHETGAGGEHRLLGTGADRGEGLLPTVGIQPHHVHLGAGPLQRRLRQHGHHAAAHRGGHRRIRALAHPLPAALVTAAAEPGAVDADVVHLGAARGEEDILLADVQYGPDVQRRPGQRTVADEQLARTALVRDPHQPPVRRPGRRPGERLDPRLVLLLVHRPGRTGRGVDGQIALVALVAGLDEQ